MNNPELRKPLTKWWFKVGLAMVLLWLVALITVSAISFFSDKPLPAKGCHWPPAQSTLR